MLVPKVDINRQLKKPGRKPHEPTAETRERAATLAGHGLPQEMIGRILGVNADTLRKYYFEELKRGEAKATALVAQTLFAKAIADDTVSCIFWLKARANWSEKIQTQQLGADDKPVDPRTMTTEELLARAEAILAKAARLRTR